MAKKKTTKKSTLKYLRDRYVGDDAQRLASLEEERHDSNNDGQIDLVILYENRLRVSAEEDRDTDGSMDSWTTYVVRDGHEVVSRIERDELGQGTVTIVEVFDTASGEAVIGASDRSGTSTFGAPSDSTDSAPCPACNSVCGPVCSPVPSSVRSPVRNPVRNLGSARGRSQRSTTRR